MENNRRVNKRKRFWYEFNILMKATISVLLSWISMTIIMSLIHAESYFQEYNYLFVSLIIFIAIAMPMAGIVEKLFLLFKKHLHNK